MKKAILINVLILFLLLNVRVEQEVVQETKEEIQIEQVEQISSRGLTEPRTENKPLKVSANGINLIKKYEGLKLSSYKLEGETDYTIGYGTSNKSIKPNQTITEEEAERLLMEEVDKVTKQVLEYCEYLDLNQNELDSLISFTYNCGFGNLQKLTGYQTRTKEEIAEHITAYTKSKSEVNRNGLKARRIEEQEIFKQSQ